MAIVDFEYVGALGNPMVDLTSMMVLYMPPNFRRKHERYLVGRYWLNLVSSGKVDSEKYTLEQCWSDYKFIGIA